MILVPHVGSNRRAIYDLAMVEHEELQQRKLFGRQLDRFAGATNAVRLEVHLQIRNAQRLRQWRAATTRQRSHPRQQLAERERLGQIIIGAGFEIAHLVCNRVARG